MNDNNFSPEEKKAKALRLCEMFESGHLELARNMLEACRDEAWLFEELLRDCTINDGTLWPSGELNRFENNELILLEVILQLPGNIPGLTMFNFQEIRKIHIGVNRKNLQWFSSIVARVPKELKIFGFARDLQGIRELTETEAYALSRCIQESSTLCLSNLSKLPNTPGHIALGEKLIRGHDKGFNFGSNLEEINAPVARLLISRKENHFASFEKLATISADVAEELSKVEGTLVLVGLQQLSEDVARKLARQNGRLILNGLPSLGVKIADALGMHKGELHLNRLAQISDEEAKGLCGNHSVLFLNGLTELSEKAAGYLGAAKSSLHLDGIKTLTGSVAKKLGNPNLKYLCLDGVRELSDAAACGLSGVGGRLSLKGLEYVSDTAAMELSKCQGPLVLLKLRTLPDSSGHISLAKKLALDNEEINFRSLTQLGDAAAEALGDHHGALNLSSLASLSDAAARALGRHQGSLDLSGLESISDKAAGFISGNKGNLNLSGLKQLSGKGAGALSLHQGELDLSQVSNLTDFGVLAFFKHKGSVKLTCTKIVSDKVAEILAIETNPLLVPNIDCSKGTPGFVKLALKQNKINTLANLSREGAQELLIAKREKPIDLSGLKILNEDVAELLATHAGELDLSGLNELPESAARQLARHEGRLNLSGLTSLPDDCFKHLSKHKGWISFYRIESLSDIAAEFLSSHEGALNLAGLKNISSIGEDHLKRHKDKIVRN